MRIRPLPLLSVAAITIAATAISAREQSESPDVLRVETRLVQVDVVVRNDDGPVTDLAADDFRLFVDGVPQDIALFEVVSAEDAGPGNGVEFPKLPEGAVTNRPGLGRGELPASATVLLIDRLNTGALQQARANEHATRFLESLDPRHQVAIYELNTSLRLVHDYTSDRAGPIRALAGAPTEFSSQLEASSGAGITGGFGAQPDEIGLDPRLVQMRENPGAGIEALGTVVLDRMVGSYYRESRLETTADVLRSIASQMAHLPGRKNLVWVAGTFPFTFDPYSYFPLSEVGQDTKAHLVEAARVITDANVAIYPISTWGLFPTPAMETMTNIANTTGGKAFYYTNGIAEAMQEAVDDTEFVYTLGFYPENAPLDDAFHEFRVEVARDDVEVRHRKGYYGFGNVSEVVDDDLGELFRDLLTSPAGATEIGLFATTGSIGPGAGEYTTRVALDVNDLRMDYVEGVWTGQVGVATVVIEPGDETAPVDFAQLVLRLTDQEYLAARRDGLELLSLQSYDSGTGWLRVVVRDPATRAAGALWVTLD